MTIRLTAAQYHAALTDIDPRTFTVTAVAVPLPIAGDSTVQWRDCTRGETLTRIPRIFAAAAVAEGQITERE
jgi:hypothetical protein